MCSIFSKNLHNTTLRVCDWEGPLRCINSSTQRREGNLMNRVPCMKARVTSLLYTAFSFSSSLYSVAVPCACYSECILLTETSWVKMACPLPPTTRIRDHQLNNALLWISQQIPIFWLGWFCLWCPSECSLLFGSKGILSIQTLAWSWNTDECSGM